MKRKKPNLLLFSNETLFEIFDNLDDKSLLNLSETCSSLRKLVERNWKIHGYNKLLQIMSKEKILYLKQHYTKYKAIILKSIKAKNKQGIVLPDNFWKFAYFHTSLLLNIKYMSNDSPYSSIDYTEIIPKSPFNYNLYPSHIYFDLNDIYIGSRCTYADPTSHLSNSGIIAVLDYKTMKPKSVISAHYGQISSMRVNEKYVASVADNSGSIRFWNRHTNALAKSFEHTSKFTALDIHEHFVVCCTKDKKLEILEASSEYEDQRIIYSTPVKQTSYTISYSNQKFATTSDETRLDIYDFENFQLLHSFDIEKPIRRIVLQDYECIISCKSFMKLYDLRSGPINFIDLKSITPRSFKFDDNRILLSDSYAYLHVIDKRMLKFIEKHDPHKRKSSFVRFHYNSHLDQIVTCGDDRRILIFDYSEFIEPKSSSSSDDKCIIQ